MDTTLKTFVAELCKDYLQIRSRDRTLKTIDELFIEAGAEGEWWRPARTLPERPYPGERVSRTFGWFQGIEDICADEASRKRIYTGVVRGLLDHDAIPERTKNQLRQLAQRQGYFAPPPGFRLSDLHPKISEASGALYRDGHYAEAVLRTCIALEQAVQERSGRRDLHGADLMQRVFSKDSLMLTISTDTGVQQGVMFLFSGAMKAVRNRLAHKTEDLSRMNALEWLAFCSALFRLLEEGKAAV